MRLKLKFLQFFSLLKMCWFYSCPQSKTLLLLPVIIALFFYFNHCKQPGGINYKWLPYMVFTCMCYLHITGTHHITVYNDSILWFARQKINFVTFPVSRLLYVCSDLLIYGLGSWLLSLSMNLTDGIILVGMTNIFNLENHLKWCWKKDWFNSIQVLTMYSDALKKCQWQLNAKIECIYLIPYNFESLTIAIVH